MKITVTPLTRTKTGGIRKREALTVEAGSARALAAAMVREGVREARLTEMVEIAPERIRIMHGRVLIM